MHLRRGETGFGIALDDLLVTLIDRNGLRDHLLDIEVLLQLLLLGISESLSPFVDDASGYVVLQVPERVVELGRPLLQSLFEVAELAVHPRSVLVLEQVVYHHVERGLRLLLRHLLLSPLDHACLGW